MSNKYLKKSLIYLLERENYEGGVGIGIREAGDSGSKKGQDSGFCDLIAFFYTKFKNLYIYVNYLYWNIKIYTHDKKLYNRWKIYTSDENLYIKMKNLYIRWKIYTTLKNLYAW